jgi:N-acylneuraminate cytidylyltransferase
MIAALVPLRGGSKSIPDKNIKLIAGKPLCGWVLEAACSATRIDRVYVSTDSARVRAVVEALGQDVVVIDRPAELAADDTATEDVIKHFAEVVPFDTVCTIQATSPLLTTRDLDDAISVFQAERYDSMLSAVRIKRFFWTDDFKPINYDVNKRPRRQDFNGTLMENGAFYLTRRATFIDTNCRLGGRIAVHEMTEETAIEIDEPVDWDLVASILKSRAAQ